MAPSRQFFYLGRMTMADCLAGQDAQMQSRVLQMCDIDAVKSIDGWSGTSIGPTS